MSKYYLDSDYERVYEDLYERAIESLRKSNKNSATKQRIEYKLLESLMGENKHVTSKVSLFIKKEVTVSGGK